MYLVLNTQTDELIDLLELTKKEADLYTINNPDTYLKNSDEQSRQIEDLSDILYIDENDF